MLPGFAGAAVHDAGAPYDCYPEATHVLCCAHLLRELVAAVETGRANIWAQQAIDAPLALKKAADTAVATGAAGIDPAALAEQVELFRHAALVGIADHSGPTSKVGKKLAAPGWMRTLTGAQQFCGIRSHLATAANTRSTPSMPSSSWPRVDLGPATQPGT